MTIKMTRAKYACNDCSKLCCLIEGCDAWVLSQRSNYCSIGRFGSKRQLKYDQNSVSGTMECYNQKKNVKDLQKFWIRFLNLISFHRFWNGG